MKHLFRSAMLFLFCCFFLLGFSGANTSCAEQLIAVQEWASVSGISLDSEGEPAADSTVCFIASDGRIAATVTADLDGRWFVTGLTDGVYTAESLINQSTAASASIVLSVGDTVSMRLSAQQGTSSLAVRTFLDKNKNGEMGKSEKIFADAKIELFYVDADSEQLISAITTTSEHDEETFEGLTTGTYRLKVTVPSGYGFSKKGNKSFTLTSNMFSYSTNRTCESGIVTLEEDTHKDFGIGIVQLSGISGMVWLDVDGDGLLNHGESGLANAKIEINGTKNGLSYETTTDATGFYSFTQLKPGGYVYRITLPDGYIFTKKTSTGDSLFTAEGESTDKKTYDLNTPTQKVNQNIGAVPASSIKVNCFVDENYNGLLDDGEASLKGAKVELYKNGTTTSIAHETIGADGVVTFSNLLGDTYKVRVTLPDSVFDFTKVVDGGNQMADEGDKQATLSGILLTPGAELSLLIGGVKPGAITGTVYMDDDYSGARSSKEETVSYLTVNLLDESGNIVTSTKTSNKGVYSFEDVYPGWYSVSITAKDGYAFTTYGTGCRFRNLGNGVGKTDTFFLPLSTKVNNMDAGMMIPAKVTGIVWCDENENGRYNSGECGLTNAQVNLVSKEGTVAATINPSANGRYTFDAVIPGTYRVVISLPETGSFVSSVDTNSFTLSADGLQASSSMFTVAAQEKQTIASIGGLASSPVFGIAFIDTNANGVLDDGEQPLSGVKLSFTNEREDANAQTQVLVTGYDGYFSAQALRPGQYSMTIELPEGYILSHTTNLTLPVEPETSSATLELSVNVGDDWSNQQLGAVIPCSVLGTMWMDENSNGVMDATEPGPAGRTIDMIDLLTGEVYATLTTDENGVFQKNDIIPGDYSLVYHPDVYATPVIGQDMTFSVTGDDLTYGPVHLSGGDSLTGLKIGLHSYTSVGGFVWIDQNGRILPLSGVSVRLMNAEGTVISTTTSNDDGSYSFDWLTEGDYILDATVPENQYMVRPDDWRVTSGECRSVMAAVSANYGRSQVFHVHMGRHLLNHDIGAVGIGDLGDYVYVDLNGNGLQDTDDGGIPGVTIQLMENGVVLAQTVTDEYGFYRFTDLYPGEYILRVAYPAEVKPTVHRTDFSMIISMMQEYGIDTYPVRVTSNGHNYNADLGFTLVNAGIYPAGYGAGKEQNWK